MAQTTGTQSGTSGRTSTSGSTTAGIGATSGAGSMGMTDERGSQFTGNQLAEKFKNVDVKGAMRDVQQRGREYFRESERYIRANPVPVVLSAAGVGLILGFLLRGKRVIHR